MQRRSRVGVVSRQALAASQTALTPGGKGGPDWSSRAAVKQGQASQAHAAASHRAGWSLAELWRTGEDGECRMEKAVKKSGE